MGKSLMQCDIELQLGAKRETEWSFSKHAFPINHSSRGGCVWARWKRVTSWDGGPDRGGKPTHLSPLRRQLSPTSFSTLTHMLSMRVCVWDCKQWNRYHFSQSGKMVSALTLPNLTRFLRPGKLKPQGRRALLLLRLLMRTFGQLSSHTHREKYTHACVSLINRKYKQILY